MIKNSTARHRRTWWVAGLVAAGCASPDLTEGRYQGMVEYEQRALAFEIAGRIAELRVERGQRVQAGDLMARQDDLLDRAVRAVDVGAVAVAEAELALVKAGSRAEDVRAAEAQLGAARAAEATARTELARQEGLVARDAAPAAPLDAMRGELAAATGSRAAQEQRVRALRSGARVEEIARAAARVAQAQRVVELDDLRVGKHVLAAPAAGVVQDLYLLPGEVAGAGVPVLAIAELGHPYADVFVPIADAPRVKLGDHARVRLEGIVDELSGVVELVHAEAELTPRFVFSPRERPHLMLRVRVRLADPDGRVHAGLPVYARFEPVVGAGA